LREIHSAWNEKNRGLVNDQASAWKIRNPEHVQALNQDRRARQRSAEGNFTPADIKRLHELQKGCCAACFKPLRGTYHIDHREALARGGSNHWTNLQLLHPRCNLKKHAHDPIEYMQKEHGLLL
jgi:5-methylcytosine-specific restriction endonuclease McrA